MEWCYVVENLPTRTRIFSANNASPALLTHSSSRVFQSFPIQPWLGQLESRAIEYFASKFFFRWSVSFKSIQFSIHFKFDFLIKFLKRSRRNYSSELAWNFVYRSPEFGNLNIENLWKNGFAIEFKNQRDTEKLRNGTFYAFMKNYSDFSILMDEIMAKGCAYRGRSRGNCLIRRVERLTEPRHRMVQSGTNDESWGN